MLVNDRWDFNSAFKGLMIIIRQSIIIIIIITIMEDFKTLFCSSKFPCASERISTKFIEDLGTRPQKGLPDPS